MPAAFYAVSFKSTLSVLGVTSLAKQAISSADDSDKLLARVIGEKLRISMTTKTSGQLLIDRTELAVDEIEVVDPTGLITDPYSHKLTGQTPTDQITAGDGARKKISKAGNTITVSLTQAGELKVTFQNTPSEKITIGLIFEGQELVTNTLQPPGLEVKFQVGGLTQNEFYAAVVIAKDVPTVAMRLKAT